jgi:hypothetical protein
VITVGALAVEESTTLPRTLASTSTSAGAVYVVLSVILNTPGVVTCTGKPSHFRLDRDAPPPAQDGGTLARLGTSLLIASRVVYSHCAVRPTSAL